MKIALITVYVALLVGCAQQKEQRCFHGGRLDTIDEANTVYVHIGEWTKTDLQIGVCKKCGEVVEQIQRGTNYYSRFPVDLKKQEQEFERSKIISSVLANWTIHGLGDYTNRPDIKGIWQLEGVQNKIGRLIILDPTNQVHTVVDFPLPALGSTVILQGDNGL